MYIHNILNIGIKEDERMIENLIKNNRSYRIFDESYKISIDMLKEMLNVARFTSSGRNMQTIRFLPITKASQLNIIYENIKWAGYLKDWNGPVEGQRPTAFILFLSDEKIKKSPTFDIDLGLACQSILLKSIEEGLGGCMIGAFNRKNISQDLNLPQNYNIELILALSKPNQNVVIEDIKEGDDIKYWKDEDNTHHVPKIVLDDLIVEI